MTDSPEQQACTAFQNVFGHSPYWITSAPGRVNLIGEFTDFNGGFVLPMAIEQRTAISAAPNNSSEIVLRSETAGETVRIDVSRPLVPESKGRWSNYPKGVLAEFVQLGFAPRGFNAVICSTVPIGAGLSSSAALEGATALLLEKMWGRKLDSVGTALLCQRAEHRYAQVRCGIMDQFICLLGRKDHVLLLDCHSNTPVWIPWTDPDVAILVVNTQVRHELSGSEYASRRESCESAARKLGVTSLREAELDGLKCHGAEMDEASLRCARHVITENHRTMQAAACIRQGDWDGLGALMYDGHESLRLDYRVSCRELDIVVDIARAIGRAGGVFGARMTGGGFGGCVLLLIESVAQDRIMRHIQTGYRLQSGIEPMLFLSRPCEGATSTEVSP